MPVEPDPAVAGAPSLRSGDVEIDLIGREIRRNASPVHVEPQVFEVIRHLAERVGRVVSKEQLLDDVWGTRFVTESALTSRIKAARRAVGDDGRRQEIIQTVHGHGYRWIAPLETSRATGGSSPLVAGPGSTLPTTLTTFIGRDTERHDLLMALRSHRLVTVAGPGGVGKTRLAIEVASAVGDMFRDGVVFVDLVEVAEATMVVAAVADAAGVVEQLAADRRSALVAALGSRELLVVLDNCEHVLSGARECVEAVLAGCPGVRFMTTSRIRLMLPYEHVYAVPGLAADGDGFDLFVARMTAAGAGAPNERERSVVADICRSLDGMALAIELAAARTPGLGVDGLERALGAELALLTVGRSGDHRHRSLRSAIDWTYQLLDPEEREVLGFAAVFAAPFEVSDVAALLGRASGELLDLVARLVDWNLVARLPTGRFRVLETIRQFATERLDANGRLGDARSSHADWVMGRLGTVLASAPGGRCSPTWSEQVDLVLADARAALAWSRSVDDVRSLALGDAIAEVCFLRGRPWEAQTHQADAARTTDDPVERHRRLHRAAGAASSRHAGRDAIELYREAADVAAASGRSDLAAKDLAIAAMLMRRAPGIIGESVDESVATELIGRARTLFDGDPIAEAWIVNAETWRPGALARSLAAAVHAVATASATGDPILRVASLDLVLSAQLEESDLTGAAATSATRLELLDALAIGPDTGFELYDGYQMACSVSIARGDFAEARRHAETIAALPFVREQQHLAVARRMLVDAIAGDWTSAVREAPLFERGWDRAGRVAASNLAVSCYAIAMAYGILGDDGRREHWVSVTDQMLVRPRDPESSAWNAVFDAVVALHRGDAAEASSLLVQPPDTGPIWDQGNNTTWRPWYAAAWAEAAVLTQAADVDDRLARAGRAACGNLVAELLVERAEAVRAHDAEGIRALADRLRGAGATYQADRSLLLAQEC